MSHKPLSERIIQEGTHTFVLDNIRKKKLVLTPEELVRQNLLDHFILVLNISKNLIKLESGLQYNKKLKRTDILIFDREAKPFLLVECKAESVKLTEETLKQISIYNLEIKAPNICISNGKTTLCFSINHESQTWERLKKIPLPA